MNKSALACEWGETELRRIVKDAFFLRENPLKTRQKAAAVIKKTVDDITLPELKQAAYISLWRFFKKQTEEIHRIPFGVLLLFLALGKEAGTVDYAKTMSHKQAREIISTSGFYEVNRDRSKQYGVPLQKDVNRYFADNIEPVFRRLIRDRAEDPDAPRNRTITLRAKAEIAVRYEHNQQMVEDLRQSGTRLVISSSHADCSERCRPWQNRVFSLDGTTGKTEDGREYVPLERATNIRTKNGKWFNGLLGFNCRHYLVPWKKGLQFGHYSETVEKREYTITIRQRELEREIRSYRIEAIQYAGVQPEKYKECRDKAREALEYYTRYSQQRGRALYIPRTEI